MKNFLVLVFGLASLVCASWGTTAGAGTPQPIATGLDLVTQIAVDGDYLYFGELAGSQGSLNVMPKSGGTPTTLAQGLAHYDSGSWRGIGQISFDSENVYAGYGGYVAYSIAQVPKTGGPPITLANISGGYQIGLIGTNLFFGQGFCCINESVVSQLHHGEPGLRHLGSGKFH